MFTLYLQQAFGVQVVIQITDDEKFLHKNFTLEQCQEMTVSNVKDILALGFDPSRTFIFTNTSYIAHLYPTVLRIQKLLTNSAVRATFGIKGSDNIGKTAFPAMQAAPCFPSAFPHLFGDASNASAAGAAGASKAGNADAKTSTVKMRCLVPQGIDQDPYFRLTRDVATRLGFHKPALIHGRFLPSLLGVSEKMGSSDPSSAVFMTDSAEEIKTKIMKHAVSGGRKTLKEHRALGAVLEVDVPHHYLRAFMEDDREFETLTENYRAGKLTTGEVKSKLVAILQTLVAKHQAERAKISDDAVRALLKPF